MAFIRFLTLLSLPASNSDLPTTLNSCSSVWWISPNRSVRPSTPPSPPCLPSIPPALSFTLPKTTPRLSIPLFADLRLFIKITLALTLIRWLTDSCHHRPLPARMPNSSISTAVSAMLINSPSSPMDLALSDILPSWVIPLLAPLRFTASSRKNSIFPKP